MASSRAGRFLQTAAVVAVLVAGWTCAFAEPVDYMEFNRGMQALKGEDYRDAVVSFNRVLAAAPLDPRVWTLLGMAREGAGDLNGARQAYGKAIHYAPGNFIARQRLAIMDAKVGKIDTAKEQLTALKDISATCAETCPDAQHLKSAIATVEAAITQGPTVAPAKG